MLSIHLGFDLRYKKISAMGRVDLCGKTHECLYFSVFLCVDFEFEMAFFTINIHIMNHRICSSSPSKENRFPLKLTVHQ